MAFSSRENKRPDRASVRLLVPAPVVRVADFRVVLHSCWYQHEGDLVGVEICPSRQWQVSLGVLGRADEVVVNLRAKAEFARDGFWPKVCRLRWHEETKRWIGGNAADYCLATTVRTCVCRRDAGAEEHERNRDRCR
jgi:hypothetical protein